MLCSHLMSSTVSLPKNSIATFWSNPYCNYLSIDAYQKRYNWEGCYFEMYECSDKYSCFSPVEVWCTVYPSSRVHTDVSNSVDIIRPYVESESITLGRFSKIAGLYIVPGRPDPTPYLKRNV